MPMRSRTLTVGLIAISLAALSCQAIAQTASAPTMPKPTCAKPEEFPGRLATDRQRTAWRDTVTVYTECIKKFVAEQKELADLNTKAANSAIEEYNAVIKTASDAVEASKQ